MILVTLNDLQRQAKLPHQWRRKTINQSNSSRRNEKTYITGEDWLAISDRVGNDHTSKFIKEWRPWPSFELVQIFTHFFPALFYKCEDFPKMKTIFTNILVYIGNALPSSQETIFSISVHTLEECFNQCKVNRDVEGPSWDAVLYIDSIRRCDCYKNAEGPYIVQQGGGGDSPCIVIGSQERLETFLQKTDNCIKISYVILLRQEVSLKFIFSGYWEELSFTPIS